MTQVAPTPPGLRPSPAPDRRVLRARRGLPNGRAVVGGFLVAVAAVGVFAAYTSATTGPAVSYAVATRDLTPGDRIDASAVRLIPIDLPDEQRRRSFDAIAPLLDTTVVEPLLAGELIQEGGLVATAASPGSRVVSFAAEASRAVDASLRAGERIDILATFGAGGEACTYVVASDVPVVAVNEATGSLVEQDALTVTVEVGNADDEVAVAHAASAGILTLVRTTHATAAEAKQFCTPTAADTELEVPAG